MRPMSPRNAGSSRALWNVHREHDAGETTQARRTRVAARKSSMAEDVMTAIAVAIAAKADNPPATSGEHDPDCPVFLRQTAEEKAIHAAFQLAMAVRHYIGPELP